MKSLFEKMKEKIKKRLEKLAEENRKIYGGKKLDCCTINRKRLAEMNNYRKGER